MASPNVQGTVTPPKEVVTFTGMCDASGAVPIDDRHFLVASDEDNVLRIYDAIRGGAPASALDLSSDLIGTAPDRQKKKQQRHALRVRPPREVDIEAATRLGDRGYFLGSHSKAGGPRSVRDRVVLFVTTLPIEGGPIELVGSPYRMLLEDLMATPALAPIDLAQSTQNRPPHEAALNIEAMTSSSDGKLWIGLRSPLYENKAVFVLIANPGDLAQGGRSRIDSVEYVDLGGRGARSLTHCRGKYLIAAGPPAKGRSDHLFEWSPGGRAVSLDEALPADFNVEAFFNAEHANRIMLLSDDGDRLINGVECKKVRDASSRRFRGIWLRG